ncbi:Uu.00g119470.m01.CDS01 [Anthostomella pinea]|uniref:Uu.00g119470.m01.CDS01 n=1 Tax=Anthostomella pinea TaxID=933095 RepID=A0AAI8VGJ5_9PEZI|nr:Uu.00g119470.m01.CDS01 [Anthostomella pinea]
MNPFWAKFPVFPPQHENGNWHEKVRTMSEWKADPLWKHGYKEEASAHVKTWTNELRKLGLNATLLMEMPCPWRDFFGLAANAKKLRRTHTRSLPAESRMPQPR